jgi:hypothetical protein
MSDTKGDLKGDYYNQDRELASVPLRDWSVDEERRAKRK